MYKKKKMPQKPGVTVDILGLRETYRIDEPIEFSVGIKGVLRGGGFPSVSIAKEDDPENPICDVGFMATEPPTAPAKYVERNLRFPLGNSPHTPIRAKEAGTYILKITLSVGDLEPYQVSRKIAVVKQ